MTLSSRGRLSGWKSRNWPFWERIALLSCGLLEPRPSSSSSEESDEESLPLLLDADDDDEDDELLVLDDEEDDEEEEADGASFATSLSRSNNARRKRLVADNKNRDISVRAIMSSKAAGFIENGSTNPAASQLQCILSRRLESVAWTGY